MNLAEAIAAVVSRKNLREEEARGVMGEIMDGGATPAQIGALLVGLRMKGESGAEITGFARAMRERSTKVESKRLGILDTCGTGGDAIKTFNLSTAAAIVASAAGVPVAKHGNRAVTSACGSADVLEALGVEIAVDPRSAGEMLDEIGLAFLFAPAYHSAMKNVAGPRKELGLRTVFNLIGPLTNPAGAEYQLIGVYSPTLVPKIARALQRLGCVRGAVVHGLIGLDEVSPVGATRLALIENGKITDKVVQAEDFGITPPPLEELVCDGIERSAAKLRTAISDAESAEAAAIIPSAAVALWLAGKEADFASAASLARETIGSGAAARKLEELAAASGRIQAVSK